MRIKTLRTGETAGGPAVPTTDATEALPLVAIGEAGVAAAQPANSNAEGFGRRLASSEHPRRAPKVDLMFAMSDDSAALEDLNQVKKKNNTRQAKHRDHARQSGHLC